MFKKLTACLLVLILTLPSLLVFANEPTARTLSVLRVDGEQATLFRTLGGRSMVPREGSRLSLGNVMTTGIDTQVYMRLDTASIVKMDEESEVAVAAAGSLLSLSVFRGSALVEVEQQEPGHTMETRIGSTVMTVRGTQFIAGIHPGGTAAITMLSGEGAVYMADETGAIVPRVLPAGYVLWAHEADMEEAFNIRPLDPQVMSLFELQETWNNREHLLEIGTITPAMEEQLPRLIDVRQNERIERREAQTAAIEAHRVQAAVTHVIVPHPPEQAVVPMATPAPVTAPVQATAGQIIRFGGYDWRVLEVRGNQALLLSEYVLFNRQYHHTLEHVTWETSDIRRYLNSDFFNRFSPQDQARIAQTYVVNNNNPWDFSDWGGHASTPGGRNTWDNVFLLSIDEVLRYFGDSGLVAGGAAMGANERLANEPEWPEWGIYDWGIKDQSSEARIARNLQGSTLLWWLRSPGESPGSAAVIVSHGGINLGGGVVFWEGAVGGGVRPALWLNL